MRKLIPLLPAIAWAAAIILTSFVFKHTSLGLPMVWGVTGVAVTLVVLRPRRRCM